MKNPQFSTNIWSLTAECSRLITIWTTVLAYRTWENGDNDDDDLVKVQFSNNIHW